MENFTAIKQNRSMLSRTAFVNRIYKPKDIFYSKNVPLKEFRLKVTREWLLYNWYGLKETRFYGYKFEIVGNGPTGFAFLSWALRVFTRMKK